MSNKQIGNLCFSLDIFVLRKKQKKTLQEYTPLCSICMFCYTLLYQNYMLLSIKVIMLFGSPALAERSFKFMLVRACVCPSEISVTWICSLVFFEIWHSDTQSELKKKTGKHRPLRKIQLCLKMGKTVQHGPKTVLFETFGKFCHYFFLEVI